MLVRKRPFKEWVNVYYDPKKITEAKILAAIKANNCPRVAVVKVTKNKLTARNGYLSVGEILQLEIKSKDIKVAKKLNLPDEWKVLGKPNLDKSKGVIYISVRVPLKIKKGTYDVGVGKDSKIKVEVVDLVS